MVLPIAEQLSLEAILTHYCEKRVPLHVRDKVRLSVFSRPVAMEGCDVMLYWPDSKRRQGWHLYDRIKPNRSIEALLAEVDKDPTGIFWG